MYDMERSAVAWALPGIRHHSLACICCLSISAVDILMTMTFILATTRQLICCHHVDDLTITSLLCQYICLDQYIFSLSLSFFLNSDQLGLHHYHYPSALCLNVCPGHRHRITETSPCFLVLIGARTSAQIDCPVLRVV